jgi:hypothetical protein
LLRYACLKRTDRTGIAGEEHFCLNLHFWMAQLWDSDESEKSWILRWNRALKITIDERSWTCLGYKFAASSDGWNKDQDTDKNRPEKKLSGHWCWALFGWKALNSEMSGSFTSALVFAGWTISALSFAAQNKRQHLPLKLRGGQRTTVFDIFISLWPDARLCLHSIWLNWRSSRTAARSFRLKDETRGHNQALMNGMSTLFWRVIYSLFED